MVSQFELHRMQKLDLIKKYFFDHCGLIIQSEIIKIWTTWIMNNVSFSVIRDEFIPDNGNDLIEILEQKMGIDRDYLDTFMTDLVKMCNDQISNKEPLRDLGHVTLTLPPTRSVIYDEHTDVKNKVEAKCLINFRNWSHQIPMSVYHKLSSIHNGDPSEFPDDLWKTVSTYKTLDGYTFHLNLSPEAHQILSEYGVVGELFASPFNHYSPRYYSLFDSDKKFGSRGNIFLANDQDFNEGLFLVHPPDNSKFINISAQMILDWLELANENNKELTFVYVMPNQNNSGIELLLESDMLREQFRLEEYQHYYYDSWHQKHVKSNHHTSFLILSTAYEQWIKTLREKLIIAMCHQK